ncbi:MAG: DNA/RNA non-specific endonuclease [Prevotella sp.]|nr:DNA/RNA non-specific endonuclease [Prevotella sp.]
MLAVTTTMTITSCGGDDDQPGSSSAPDGNRNRNNTDSEPALARLEFPKVKGGADNLVIIHTTNDQYGINYSVEWDIAKKAQRWSCYQMSAATIKKATSRYYDKNNQYPMDPSLPSAYYTNGDLYWGSGFSHGHICPSADRLYSAEANKQTFYLTNMQPQYSMFNGGKNYDSPWIRLEDQVRSWAGNPTFDTLYVVKGGTIDDDQILTKIQGQLRVPKYFFVALLGKTQTGYRAVGFWIEHDDKDHGADPLGSYAMNIAELEARSGIDFFCNLPDDTEQHVENLPIDNVRRAWGL